jgi:hypothetical protein
MKKINATIKQEHLGFILREFIKLNNLDANQVVGVTIWCQSKSKKKAVYTIPLDIRKKSDYKSPYTSLEGIVPVNHQVRYSKTAIEDIVLSLRHKTKSVDQLATLYNRTRHAITSIAYYHGYKY